ncbi:MAG: PfaD family polyunsaturated fatty acid/polyketide biosynthesis protein [Desulfuromonadaceae bacterium]
MHNTPISSHTVSFAGGHSSEFCPLGAWVESETDRHVSLALPAALMQVNKPVYLCRDHHANYQVHTTGRAIIDKPDSVDKMATGSSQDLLAYASPLPPHACGDAAFLGAHKVRYPLIAGSMAKGISSATMVKEMGEAGMLGFLGSAGLEVDSVEAQLRQLQQELDPGGYAYGCNLIHSPNEPELEQKLVEMYVRIGLNLIEASAFLQITPPLVEYRLQGIHRDEGGRIITPNRIIAKVSREEVATHFLSPAPQKIVKKLQTQGKISAKQAELARYIPMADDITAEADSGGHTDNRPAMALLPTIVAVRNTLQQQYQYQEPPRIGLGGGIATPYAAAGAFAMGAAYIVTGSVNQACVEAGTCDAVKQMLAEAQQADIAMAPAADMFEMGVDVQVLKRGTMFSLRAASLYELYRNHSSIENIPQAERAKLEKTVFKAGLDEVWENTRAFFARRDPREIERAEKDPKHKMALIFRSYLGQATHWAIAGDPQRRIDYQIWCGPALPAFNAWTKGTFMQQPEERKVVDVNLNLLLGAAVWLRANMLGQVRAHYEKTHPDETLKLQPLTREQMDLCLHGTD